MYLCLLIIIFDFIVIKKFYFKITKNIIYRKVHLNEDSQINQNETDIFVCSYDIYTKEILPRVIMIKNGKRMKNSLIRINKKYIKSFESQNYKINFREALKNITTYC